MRDRVRVNATIARQRTEAAAYDALLAVASGFSCIKLKVGMEPSIEAEVERVETIRQVIGVDTRLRLDANGAWSTEDNAIASIRALEPHDIELIEQPIPPGRLRGLRPRTQRGHGPCRRGRSHRRFRDG